jgi:uncharacterized protein with HEPN domain
MQRDARAFLWDVQQAADTILRFVAGLDVHTYAETELVHSAVERKFEIIGEALSQLAKLDPVLARRIPDIRKSLPSAIYCSTATPWWSTIASGGSPRHLCPVCAPP